MTASTSISLVVSKNPPQDNAMSIIVGTSASTGSVQAGGYIVINLGASSQPVIDWTATAGTYPTGLGNTGWTALLGGAVSGIAICWLRKQVWWCDATERWPPPPMGGGR
ncbi:hypothetical protein [Xanthomonas sp. LMC-A-07]|uniref:hypothetical protein n=1 Tax=Xanthomonas sp. LMC-A-07 TaxID=3040329 RepID=UPI0025566D96|nr:hypothetical protein [Xanthomonas sp. LMC-A-07]